MRTLSRFAMLILVAAQTAPSNTSSITGIVSRAGTAEALDQAVVSLIPAANITAPPNVETDAAGRFTFRNVPPGRYAIQVRREGYFGPLLHGASQPFASRLITLTVRSSLEAVGLLAAITARLADAGISVNAVSAFHHDHEEANQ